MTCRGGGYPEFPGDRRAPVPALGAVAFVAQPRHELVPCQRDPLDVPSGLVRRTGKAVAGDGGNHEVECVGWIAAVCSGVGERADDFGEFHDRAWPAVRHDQRYGVRLGRADVHEVHALSLDRRGELRETVQLPLMHAPVVSRAPVLREVAQVPERYAVVPADARKLVGPARPGEPGQQVVQIGLGNLDAEGGDLRVVCHATDARPHCGRTGSAMRKTFQPRASKRFACYAVLTNMFGCCLLMDGW